MVDETIISQALVISGRAMDFQTHFPLSPKKWNTLYPRLSIFNIVWMLDILNAGPGRLGRKDFVKGIGWCGMPFFGWFESSGWYDF